MYRFQFVTMSCGSAGLSPLAVANTLRVEPNLLPIDLPGLIENMHPRSDLVVYCFESGELPGMHLGPSYVLAHEKPDGTGHIIDSGGRSSSPSPMQGVWKIRAFSSKGLNYYDLICFVPAKYADPASAATG